MDDDGALVGSAFQALQSVLMPSNKRYNLVQPTIGFLQLSGGKTDLLRCLGYIGA